MFRIAWGVVGLLAGVCALQADTLYAIDDAGGGTNLLYSIDPNSLAVSLIGSTGQTGEFGAIAYDTANNTMYFVPGRLNDNLYTLNLATGAATLVGSYGVGQDMNALTYDPNTNQLFAFSYFSVSNGTQLYSLNQNTGAATDIGQLNLPESDGLAYNTAANQLVLIQADSSFYSVNETTAATSLLGNYFTYINNAGIAYDPSRNEYWVASILSELNQYSASYQLTTSTAMPSDFDQIAWVGSTSAPTVPEPGTGLAAAMGMGALAGWWRARRA